MLVLSRRIGEKLVINKNITLTVVDIRGDKVRLGIDAPRDISIHREEVALAIELALAQKAANEAEQPEPSSQPTC